MSAWRGRQETDKRSQEDWTQWIGSRDWPSNSSVLLSLFLRFSLRLVQDQSEIRLDDNENNFVSIFVPSF